MRCVTAAVVAVLACAAVPANADVLVAIDKGAQRMAVSVDGAPTYHWTISTGRSGYDTPEGRFRAIRLEQVYYSKKFDDAPMPNSVFFYGGYAIHGTLEEGKLGRPVSHGCVRLARANAATLYALVRAHGMSNTRVVVSGGASYATAPRREREASSNVRSEGRREFSAERRVERSRPAVRRVEVSRRRESPRRGFEQFGEPVRTTRMATPQSVSARRVMTEAEYREFARRNGFRP